MKTMDLQRAPERMRKAAPPPRAILAQRRAGFGGERSVTAPPIVDAGRPLDTATRGHMESGFGRDFGHVRVHDDARAHDNAHSLNARAYAAGEHIVFGQGAYRPHEPSGQALLAHELAHTVQQGGVQMKTDGPMPGAVDTRLEREADMAALAITGGRPAPALSRIGGAAVFRAGEGATTPVATPVVGTGGKSAKLPSGMTAKVDKPEGLGTDELLVDLDKFEMPLEKGDAKRVEAVYGEAAAGERLIFAPLITGGTVAAFKEASATETYKNIWLRNYGFTTTQGLAKAFKDDKAHPDVKAAMADPSKGVADIVTGMQTGLSAAKSDVDHIVEKQLQGTSIPSNLQLLNAQKNRDAGRETYLALKTLVDQIRSPAMRGPGVKEIKLRIRSVVAKDPTPDGSAIVEQLLRDKKVSGSEAVKAAAKGKLVKLSAGGVGETTDVVDASPTPVAAAAARVIAGMTLLEYRRGQGGEKSPVDTIGAQLQNRVVANKPIELTAKPAPARAKIGVAAAGQAAENNAAASETRVIGMPKTGAKIEFYYPYLSPGTLTSMKLDDQGNMTATGNIRPSIPIFKQLDIKYGPNLLALVAPLGKDQLKSPIAGLRFTDAAIDLKLAPKFEPSGFAAFEIGPAGKPVLVGRFDLKYDGGAIAATGKIRPGSPIPGVSEAEGDVEYHSEKGWSGKLSAKSSSIPKSVLDLELGFKASKGADLAPYARGGITTTVRNSELKLTADWKGGTVGYAGEVTIEKPMPLVERVKLVGGYSNGLLKVKGEAPIKWRNIDSKMTVTYSRKDGDGEGKFGGTADVTIKTEKADGLLKMNFAEGGGVWGEGEVSYQVTKDIRPKLSLRLDKVGKVLVIGSVKVNDIPLTKKWPKPEGGTITLIKGVGVKFPIPLPPPVGPLVSAFGEIKGSLGVNYGVGPVALTGVNFAGELYPLEDDPKIKAKLTGALVVPGYANIYGTFGAYIGAEVAGGALSAKGGVEATPTVGVRGEAGVKIDLDYNAQGFSFEALAYAKGQMSASLKVDLAVELAAGYGAFTHRWTYNIVDLKKDIGPELNLTLGRIAYDKDGKITLPELSQIKVTPEKIDPMEIVRDLLSDRAKVPATST